MRLTKNLPTGGLILLGLLATTVLFAMHSSGADEPAPPATQPKVNAAKPVAAIFPLGGPAEEKLRDQYGFALRAKLDRDGTYDVIDGYRMKDISQDYISTSGAITFDTPPDAIKKMGADVDATILVWGDVSGSLHGSKLRLKILDLREIDALPRSIEKTLREPTDLRFAVEEILQTLPGVAAFEHPSENEATLDPQSIELWKKNPNLVIDGNFAEAGHWDGIYESEKYPVQISDELPPMDKVCIYRLPANSGEGGNALAMTLDRECAENNGLACLSDAIAIEPHQRYRLSFFYKSDGPTLHVFVKGYTPARNIKGDIVMREIYRRQVSPTGGTHGQWRQIVSDLNPDHPYWPVKELRIDLYAYLHPGTVLFRDIELKDVGKPTDTAKDEALKPPVTKPGE